MSYQILLVIPSSLLNSALSVIPRALLIANFHERVAIWTHPSQEPAKFVLVTSYWQCEHEWRKNISVATEWLSAVSPYRWISSKSGVLANSKSVFEKNFTSPTIDTSAPTTVSSSCNTMHGTVENPGVTVFTIKVLFSKIRTRSYDGNHVVHLSYLEVYNETVRDLISPGRPLVLREDKQVHIFLSSCLSEMLLYLLE